MSVITTSPYSLAVGQAIQAEVAAYNINGWSDFSDANSVGINAQGAPSAITVFASDASQTDESQIEVHWSAPSNGGSAITSYNLQWDAGTNGASWSNLLGGTVSSLATSYTVVTGVTPGGSY
mmetsp:Transcript_33983/g.25072  ORF Transcript_33983/g.25072 Transcript_33983/m.25072 type:complete len:122 (-) Transcript_33983:157-522(-)